MNYAQEKHSEIKRLNKPRSQTNQEVEQTKKSKVTGAEIESRDVLEKRLH